MMASRLCTALSRGFLWVMVFSVGLMGCNFTEDADDSDTGAEVVVTATDSPTLLSQALAALAGRDTVTALEQFEACIRAGDAEQALCYFHRAGLYASQADRPAALADYNQALALDLPATETALAYMWRGDLYFAAGDVANALNDYTQALAQEGRLGDLEPRVYAARGDVYYTQGDLAAALADYRQALGRADALPTKLAYEAYSKASTIYQAQQNYGEARNYRLAAFGLDPKVTTMVVGDYDLVVRRVTAVDQASGDRPRRGLFLVIEITIFNNNLNQLCLKEENFLATLPDGTTLEPEKQYQVAAAYGFTVGYPGDRPRCIAPYDKWETFLSYDVTAPVSEISITFTPAGLSTVYKLLLTANPATGVYDFIPLEQDGAPLARIGQTTIIDDDIQEIIDPEPITINNCIGGGTVTQTIARTHSETRERTVQVDTKTGVDVNLETQSHIPIGPVLTYLETRTNIYAEMQRSVSDNEAVTISKTESFAVEVPSATFANYEVVWYIVSVQTAVEVIVGDHTYSYIASATDSLRGEIRSLPPTPCDSVIPTATPTP